MLERSEMARAFERACAKTGNRIAARIAIIAITARSSISVKALVVCRERDDINKTSTKDLCKTTSSHASGRGEGRLTPDIGIIHDEVYLIKQFKGVHFLIRSECIGLVSVSSDD
jgi:hypothetical protein